MKWIDYENPSSVDDAVKILAESGGKAKAMAGGTDLIVQLRVKDPRVDANTVVNVKNIPELNELSYSASGGLTIGAAVPCHIIYNNEDVKKTLSSFDRFCIFDRWHTDTRKSFPGGKLV